jgi:hypothetical protein
MREKAVLTTLASPIISTIQNYVGILKRLDSGGKAVLVTILLDPCT